MTIPGLPAAQGLYDPRHEHDACGVGVVAHRLTGPGSRLSFQSPSWSCPVLWRPRRPTPSRSPTATASSARSSASRAYRYDTPELDLALSVSVYLTLSDWGRVRTEGDIHARYEALKSLFLTLTFQLPADSRPPSEDTPESDFTTTLSLSWKS